MLSKRFGKKAAILGAIVVATTVLAILSPRYIHLFAIAENWANDYRVTFANPPAKPHTDIIILAITEETLSKLPYRSPVDRSFLAKTIDTLVKAKVRAIGLDILFDQPTEAAKDEALRKSILNAPVPIVTGWTDTETGLTEKQYKYQQTYLKDIKAGYSNLSKDPTDSTVREHFPGRNVKGKFHLSFSGMLSKELGFSPPLESIRIAYRGKPNAQTPSFPQFPIHALSALPKQWFAGKVVLIGADLPFGDRHRTPFAAGLGVKKGVLPGVVIQAHMLSQNISGNISRGSSIWAELAVIFVLCLIALVLAVSEQSLPLKIIESLGVITLFWVGCVWLFSQHGFNLPMVSPAFGFGTVMGIGSLYVSREHMNQTKFIRNAFSHYLSPAMVEKLADDPAFLKLGGDQRDMTLLFCDVRGFTTISEQFDATGLTALINKLLTPLTNVVMKHQGTVDKYMGDCIMAFWNAPMDVPDHHRLACLCAMEMIDEIAPLNERLEKEALDEGRKHIPLKVGIGLNSGEAVVGNMGSDQRFDYSVLGDTVNLAARLEGQCKTYDVSIVIGENTHSKIEDLAGIELDLVLVQGKTQAIRIFTLVGDNCVAQTDEFLHLNQTHQAMLSDYRAQNWSAARKKLTDCRQLGGAFELAGLYNLYEARIDAYEAAPPPSDWDGVFVATSK